MSAIVTAESLTPARKRKRSVSRQLLPAVGGVIICILAFTAVFAPLIAPYDPTAIDVAFKLKPSSSAHWLGTDILGRDILSRIIYGGQVSLAVGLGVATLATLIGVCLGVVVGFSRAADRLVTSIMDGMMAIPGILLAIALVAATRPTVVTVIIAITVPEIPRVVRLVRSIVLTIRELPYVEAARSIGTRGGALLWRYFLPNALGPLTVQATFICASAILSEAYLSFLGAGISAPTATWGNIIAEGKSVVQIAYWVVLFPGLLLGLTVLSINILGDALRDALDPRMARRV